ncbi:hypothetical protein A9G29_11270 [Gilliamella sp. Fer2-1]|jgi:hypothetical protein|nr:hypothetical protein A9G29_11270 [Gilliamella apicola]
MSVYTVSDKDIIKPLFNNQQKTNCEKLILICFVCVFLPSWELYNFLLMNVATLLDYTLDTLLYEAYIA